MLRKDSNLIDIILIIIKWRKILIINFLCISILAAAYSLIMPHTYKSSTTILPPLEDASGIGLSSLLSQMPIGGLGFGMVSEETYKFLSILKSRTIMESVITKFDLIKRYKSKNMEEAVKTLRKTINVNVNDNGTINLTAEANTKHFPGKVKIDSTRNLSKEIANYFIKKLDIINKRLKVERAKNIRLFIEKRYKQNINDLQLAEDELKLFQEKCGAIALPEQLSASISVAANMQAQITTKEIELAVLKNMVGTNHSKVNRIQKEIKELNKKYDELRHGNSIQEFSILLPLDDAPDLGVQFARLYREVMLQEKILEFVLPQYEQAKFQEAKDTPTVQILDKAIIPIKRIKPKRSIFVLFWGFLSIFITSFCILASDNYNKLKTRSPDKYEKINLIIDMFKTDLKIKRDKLDK